MSDGGVLNEKQSNLVLYNRFESWDSVFVWPLVPTRCTNTTMCTPRTPNKIHKESQYVCSTFKPGRYSARRARLYSGKQAQSFRTYSNSYNFQSAKCALFDIYPVRLALACHERPNTPVLFQSCANSTQSMYTLLS